MIVKNCTLIKALTCEENTTITEVAKILRKNKQRRIIIVDNNEYPIGIISTTDMNNKVVAENKLPGELKAKQIMESPIYLICDIQHNLNDLYQKMVEHESYFVPVTKDGKVFGILTYGELFKRIKEVVKNG